MGKILVQVADNTPSTVELPGIRGDMLFNTVCELYCQRGWRREHGENSSVFFKAGRDPVTVTK